MDCADDILGTRRTFTFNTYGIKYDGKFWVYFSFTKDENKNVRVRVQKQNILNGLPSTYSDEEYSRTENELSVSI